MVESDGYYYNRGKRYLVFSGGVISQNDGQRHEINSLKVMESYNVDPRLCVVRTPRGAGIPESAYAGLIRLFPRSDGNYKIPD